jgi:hypothetical protein
MKKSDVFFDNYLIMVFLSKKLLSASLNPSVDEASFGSHSPIRKSGPCLVMDLSHQVPTLNAISTFHNAHLWTTLPSNTNSVVRNISEDLLDLKDLGFGEALVSRDRHRPFKLSDISQLYLGKGTSPDLRAFISDTIESISMVVSREIGSSPEDLMFNVIHRLYRASDGNCFDVGWHQDNIDPGSNTTRDPKFRINYTFVTELGTSLSRWGASRLALFAKGDLPASTYITQLVTCPSTQGVTSHTYAVGNGLGFNNLETLHSVRFDGVKQREILIFHVQTPD